MDKTFHFSQLSPSDSRDEFLAAWRAAFERDLDPSILSWVFGPESGNRLHIARCVEDDRIAGGYCMLPQIMIVGGRPRRGLLCNNVFSTPEYRTHNLFVKLGRHALAESAADSDLALGFPNAVSLPGHRRVGWTVCPPVVFHERAPGPDAPPDGLRPLAPEDLPAVEELWLDPVDSNGFRVVKTPAYFTWRYFHRPRIGRAYHIDGLFSGDRLEGYLVLSHYFEKNRLHIVDIRARSDAARETLLRHAAGLAGRLGAIGVNAWGSPALQPALLKAGFSPSGEQTNMIVKPLRPDGDAGLAESLISHHAVLGDNDVF